MTPAAARKVLVQAGIDAGPAPLVLEPRDGRWLARLPGERLAWFPRDAEGAERLARERRVLRLIEEHCRFEAPRVLAEGEGGWDVRTLVPSACEAFEVFRRAGRDPAYARRLGRRLGEMIADQHQNLPVEPLRGWLPAHPGWPSQEELVHLHEVVEDPALLARAAAALARWEATPMPAEVVVAHGDLGLHNIAFAADGQARGLFDYDGAWLGDRCEDFKYLILDGADETLLEAALAAYEPLTGANIDLGRVRLLNAAAAIGFLAFRRGHEPEEPWCGRTLAEDLAWTDGALRAIGL